MADRKEQLFASETGSSENFATVTTHEKGEGLMEPAMETTSAKRSLRRGETHCEIGKDDALSESEDVEKGEKVHAKEESIDVEGDSEPARMTASQDAQDAELMESESNASQSEEESDFQHDGDMDVVSSERIDALPISGQKLANEKDKLDREHSQNFQKMSNTNSGNLNSFMLDSLIADGEAVIKPSTEANKKAE